MSETVLPEQASTADVPPHSPLAKPARSGAPIAVLALLVAAAGVAVGGWGVWQGRQLAAGHQQQSAQLESLSAQAQVLKQSEQQLDARVAQLPPASELEERRRLVAQLQGDQQRLSQRLESVVGASRKDWRLAEAEHLVRLASLRLSALQDLGSARALVLGADEILREQDDPAAFGAREQLAKSMAALDSLEQPDRTGLFLQLAGLREQAAQLSVLAPEFQAETPASALDDQSAGFAHWRQWWQTISGFFRIEFKPDDNIRPLLAGQNLQQVRLALSLTLEQAQWAALNGQGKVYVEALDQAHSILGSSFSQDNSQARAMLARLEELKAAPVTVNVPDLTPSLSALQAYMAQRHTPVDSAKLPAGATPPAEAAQGATP